MSSLRFLHPTATVPGPRDGGDPPSATQETRWNRATCLHYAAGGWDVLGDADFVAALKEDGSVVIDIQDGDVHGGSPGASVPRGAVVCSGEKGEGRLGHLLERAVLSLWLLKTTEPTFLNKSSIFSAASKSHTEPRVFFLPILKEKGEAKPPARSAMEPLPSEAGNTTGH